MSGSRSEQTGPIEVEDTETGQRYLMYSLPVGVWPAAPRVVYECATCKKRFAPEQWSGGCPGCAKPKKRRKRRK